MPPRCPRGRTSRRRRAPRRRPLEHDLPAEQHERSRDVEAVGEERAVAGIGPLLRAHPADGEDHLVGLAREQVAAARAAVDEQPDPGRHGCARSPRSPSGRSRRSSCRSPSRPSGRPGCPRWSRAGSRPGWRRSATRGRAPTRSGGASRRASQRAIVGALPSRIARRRTGSASPSISRKTIPGTSVRASVALPPRDPLHHPQRVGVVVVGADDHLEHQRDDRHHQRGQQRTRKRVDSDVSREARRSRASAASRRRAAPPRNRAPGSTAASARPPAAAGPR